MLRAVIVDDERDAIQFITSIIEEYCPEIEVAGTASNAASGVSKIQEVKPDLVFLDVEMPHGSGFDLLSSFPNKSFDVIFITAFNHYAIRAIKFSAIDYILKPINISEFKEAVEKVKDKRNDSEYRNLNYETLLENLKAGFPSKLAIPTSEGMEYLDTKEIIRIEADRSYSWFYMVGGEKHLVSRNLKEYQELLGDQNFFRPHNSHLINLNHVKKYVRHEGGYIIMSDESSVPMSRGKKDLFLTHMAKVSK